MPEDSEIDYSSLSTRELIGKTSVTHGKQIKEELPRSIWGAIKKLGFEVQQHVNPQKSQQHELHQYFGPEVSPDPDDRETFNNPLSFRRHEVFEREGTFIRSLRRRGAETIGEIQGEIRNWTNSIYWRTDEEGVGRIHNSPDTFLIRAYELTFSGDRDEARRRAIEGLDNYAEEVAYHNLLINFFANDSRLCEKFVQDPEFKKLREQFTDAHIGASKADNLAVASAMLAGHYLMQFEGSNPENSPSQKFIRNASEYHQKVGKFIEEAGGEGLPPSLTRDRKGDLANLEKATLTSIDRKCFPNGVPDAQDERDDALKRHLLATETLCRIVSHPDVKPEIRPNMSRWEEGQQILQSLDEQFERHKIDLEWLRRIKAKFPNLLIVDPEGRRNFIQTVIGNTLMGVAPTADGKVYTASRYMPLSEGYFGADNPYPIPDLEPSSEIPTTGDLCGIIKDIYNGQPGTEKGREYRSQTQKIYEAAPKILRYLQKADNVPDEVRQLIEVVTSKEDLAKKITARFGSETDQDINYVNVFFRGGRFIGSSKVYYI